MRRFVGPAVVITVLVALLPATPANSNELESKFSSLLVATEISAGYSRSFFRHWIDADQNGCNARFEVLIAEAVTAPNITSGCRLVGGSWRSLFDNKIINDASLLDVDHFVPLAEAWRSGAAYWSPQQRKEFANDLSLPDSLIAVSRSSNRAKSDRDVASWLPSNRSYVCQYLVSWVAVKAKWKLAVDVEERRALENGLLECGEIAKRTTPKLAPNVRSESPKLQPKATRYQNCTLARAAGVTPIRSSTNPARYQANVHLDRDKDGVACE